MAYTQTDKLLRITTILDEDGIEGGTAGDPLLLVKLEASERISRLSTFDIVMLRDTGRGVGGTPRPPLDPTRLIGTHVKIGARPSTREHFLYRVGMVESCEQVVGMDAVQRTLKFRDFYTYRARVVPWPKILTRDICFRVFENKSVVDIIRAVSDEVRSSFPHLKIDASGLSSYPKMDYCVQFGESTFDFLSRLMSRFGIWYYFAGKEGPDVLNDTMVLMPHSNTTVPASQLNEVSIVEDDPSPSTIARLVRRYRPPERRVVVGGFNQLVPTSPFYKDHAVDPKADLLHNEGGGPAQSRWLGATGFAEPVNNNTDADDLVKVRGYENQTEVVSLSGISRNVSFLPAHSFRVKQHQDEDPFEVAGKEFIIDWHTISCHDYNYGNLGAWQALDIFFSTYAAVETDSASFIDSATAKASMWLAAHAQDHAGPIGSPLRGAPNQLGQAWWASSALAEDSAVPSLPLQLGALSSTLWLLAHSLDEGSLAKDNRNQATFANSFTACASAAPVEFPLPPSVRPVARGPHTAVVIGQDGVSTNNHDIYYDAIGRVRVRFPWDPGPPSGGSLPPVFPVSQPDKPTRVGDNTCWLRVVEGWAGRHYGSQFLPRIGQEVLVDFLDGDPERPVIVGRLYNADKGNTNLPFVDDATEAKQLNTLADLPPTAAYDNPYSGFKTFSIPTEKGPKRFHLLRFKDKRDDEQYLIRSQKRMDVTAFGTYYDSTLVDRHLTVGSSDDGGNVYTKMFADYHLHTLKSRFEQIDQNYELHVKANTSFKLDANWTTSVANTQSMSATTIVLSATANITLVCGASSVVLTPASVAITGPVVLINSGGSPAPALPVIVTPPTDPTAADPGDKNPL